MSDERAAAPTSTLPARPGKDLFTTARSSSGVAPYVEPPLTSRVAFVVLVFFLTVHLPPFWFVVETGNILVEELPASGYFGVLLAGLTAYAVATLGDRVPALLGIASLEPLLPAFLGLALLSFTWSTEPMNTLRQVIPLLMILALGYWAIGIFRLQDLLLYFCFAFLAAMVLSYLFIFALPTYGVAADAWSGVFSSKNSLGRTALLSALHFFLAAGTFRRFRVFWLVSTALAVAQVIGSSSGTAIGSLVLVAGLLAVFRIFRARRLLFGAVAVSMLGAGVLAALLATANLGAITSLLGKDVTLTGRTLIWQLALESVRERPLLGYGWGGYWNGWMSPSRRVLLGGTFKPSNAHNALIEYLLNLGVLGASLAVAIFVRLVVRGTRTIRDVPGPLALWPLSFAAIAMLNSVTEVGVIGRDSGFLLLVILTSAAAVTGSGDRHHPKRFT